MEIDVGILALLFGYLVNCVTGGIVYRHLPAPFRLLVIQAFVAFFIDVFGFCLITVAGYRNNLVIFNLYMPFEFLLLLFAARTSLGKHFRPYAIICISIFSIVWVSSLIINGIMQFANQVVILYGLMLTVAYFMVLLRNVHEERSNHTTGIYFISASIILYYCCTIPHFGLIHYFDGSDLRFAGYYVSEGLGCLRHLCTAIGLIFLSRPAVRLAVHANK